MSVQPQVKYRHDYMPPAFLIDRVDLQFDIEDEVTKVHSRLAMTRNEKAEASADLVLDGSARLTGVVLDGQRLSEEGYRVGEGTLTVFGVPTVSFSKSKPS